jgi:CheB methylesterase/histidine kinase/DNA gyrase B/HSP90-like ATPase
VTRTSGRGLGMDIVRRIATGDLGGELTMSTTPGSGTAFTLRVPLTIAVVDVSSFVCSRQTFVVPVSSVDEIFELRKDHLVHGLCPGVPAGARGDRRSRARLAGLPYQPFMPSVNELFRTGAAAVGAGALGVILTGMGDDGLEGARTIASARGSLLTEAASTSVVYGMPRCVYEAGLGAEAAPQSANGSA